MNDLQIRYIKEQLEKNKGIMTEITFDKLKSFARSKGMCVTVRATKKDVVEIIFNSDYADEFMENHKQLFMVPDFYLKKVYGLNNTKNVHSLEELGLLPVSDEKEILTKNQKFICRAYPLSSLEADKDALHQQEQLLNTNEFKLRIEIQDIEKLSILEEKLKQFMNIKNHNSVFKNRDGSYYCYYIASLDEHSVNADTQKNQ